MRISSPIHDDVSSDIFVQIFMGQAAELYACMRLRALLCPFHADAERLQCGERQRASNKHSSTFPLCDYGLFRNNAAILMRLVGIQKLQNG